MDEKITIKIEIEKEKKKKSFQLFSVDSWVNPINTNSFSNKKTSQDKPKDIREK